MEEKLKQEELPTELDTQDQEKSTNIVPLSIIGGGKGGGDWLSNLPIGCEFYAKIDKSQIDLFEYCILGRRGEKGKATVLVLIQHNEEKVFTVDPVEFSKKMSFYDIISN